MNSSSFFTFIRIWSHVFLSCKLFHVILTYEYPALFTYNVVDCIILFD